MSATNVPQHRNEVHLAGVLAKEPTVRATTTGKKVASVTLATTYNNRTEYHRVTCWEELANRVEKLAKGDFIKLIGRLQTRSWEKDGQKHYTTEVVAWNLGTAKDAVTVSTTGKEITDHDIPW